MSKIIDGGKVVLKERIKEEMHQSMVEMGTNICENINQARDEVSYLRQQIIELAAKEDLKVAAAGTHPFSHWSDQLITPNPRYDQLIAEMKDVELRIDGDLTDQDHRAIFIFLGYLFALFCDKWAISLRE